MALGEGCRGQAGLDVRPGPLVRCYALYKQLRQMSGQPCSNDGEGA